MLFTKELAVISEVDLCQMLNLKGKTVDWLRLNKDLPYVRLTKFDRVYFAADVVKWLESQKQ